MGSNESKIKKQLQFKKEQWSLDKEQSQKHNISIYTNIYNPDAQLQLHEIILDSATNIQEQLEIYNYRKVQDSALVSVDAVEHVKESASTCGNTQKFMVYTERIPFRLTDLGELSFRETVYVLSESLRGFSTCYRNVGMFKINGRMIGINKFGQAKVWLNEKFEQNYPKDNNVNLETTSTMTLKMNNNRYQQDMLHILFKTIQQKCTQTGRYPSQFNRILYQSSNFQQAYQSIEKYCKSNQISVPDRIAYQGSVQLNKNSKADEKKIKKVQNRGQKVENIQSQSYNSDENVEVNPRIINGQVPYNHQLEHFRANTTTYNSNQNTNVIQNNTLNHGSFTNVNRNNYTNQNQYQQAAYNKPMNTNTNFYNMNQGNTAFSKLQQLPLYASKTTTQPFNQNPLTYTTRYNTNLPDYTRFNTSLQSSG